MAGRGRMASTPHAQPAAFVPHLAEASGLAIRPAAAISSMSGQLPCRADAPPPLHARWAFCAACLHVLAQAAWNERWQPRHVYVLVCGPASPAPCAGVSAAGDLPPAACLYAHTTQERLQHTSPAAAAKPQPSCVHWEATPTASPGHPTQGQRRARPGQRGAECTHGCGVAQCGRCMPVHA